MEIRKYLSKNRTYPCDFLAAALSREPQRVKAADPYRYRWQDGRYTYEREFLEENSELKFQGDGFSQPNGGWTLAHANKICWWYAEKDLNTLRKWAYVMWDHERLMGKSQVANKLEKFG